MGKTSKTQHNHPTERPNGFTPKGFNLVPISIITGTRL